MTAHTAMHHDSAAAALAVSQYETARRIEHDHKQSRNAQLYAIGRMFVASLFVVSAVAKVLEYSATVAALRDTIAAPELLVPFAIGIELLGGALLFVGFKARPVALGLMVYLACVTVLVHHDLSQVLNRSFALANLAFAGALLMVYAHGAGALSLDRRTHLG